LRKKGAPAAGVTFLRKGYTANLEARREKLAMLLAAEDRMYE
jgi:hypothetical protein